MTNTSRAYHHTNIQYDKSQELAHFIENEATWAWEPHFHVCQNFREGIFKDAFIKAVNMKFGGFLSLYKIPARCVYKWHKDSRHFWSINMVLDTFNSHTLFEERTENTLIYIDELIYKPREWVIFNTQELHTIINIDNRDRVLVTYRIGPHNSDKWSYQEVLDWFQNEYQAK
jgi:hypothetical protein